MNCTDNDEDACADGTTAGLDSSFFCCFFYTAFFITRTVVLNGVPGTRSFEEERRNAAVPFCIGGTGTGTRYIFM